MLTPPEPRLSSSRMMRRISRAARRLVGPADAPGSTIRHAVRRRFGQGSAELRPLVEVAERLRSRPRCRQCGPVAQMLRLDILADRRSGRRSRCRWSRTVPGSSRSRPRPGGSRRIHHDAQRRARRRQRSRWSASLCSGLRRNGRRRRCASSSGRDRVAPASIVLPAQEAEHRAEFLPRRASRSR